MALSAAIRNCLTDKRFPHDVVNT